MNNKSLIIALLVIALGAIGYIIYQEQQKESVSVSIGGQSLSIETE